MQLLIFEISFHICNYERFISDKKNQHGIRDYIFRSFLVLCLVYLLKNTNTTFLKNTPWGFGVGLLWFFFLERPLTFSFEYLWDFLVLTARNKPGRTPQWQAAAAEWKSARGPVLGCNLFREETGNCCCQFTYLCFAVSHRAQHCVWWDLHHMHIYRNVVSIGT